MKNLDGVVVPDLRLSGCLPVTERAVALAEVDQRRSRWAGVEVDHAAEHDYMIPAVEQPLDLAANGRERVLDVRRAVVGMGLEAQAGGLRAGPGPAEVAGQILLALAQNVDREFAGLLNEVAHTRVPVNRDLHEQRIE